MKIEDLQPFCSTDELRPKMATPWIEDGFAYATNGHIGIKIKFEGENSIGDYHDLNKLIEEVPEMMTMKIDFSQQINYKTEPLYKVIKEQVDCDDCEGEGMIECCECGQDRDCPKCGGKGILQETTYSEDIEKIVIDESCLIKINDAYFNPVYTDLIQKFLPKVGTVTYTNPIRAMKIKFDDAEIILMPVKVDDTKEFEYTELKVQNEQ